MKRLKLAPWIALMTLVGLAGCESAKVPETFPQAAADGWVAAFNSGDAEGLALMYSPDAEIFPPDQPLVNGYDAIGSSGSLTSPGKCASKRPRSRP